MTRRRPVGFGHGFSFMVLSLAFSITSSARPSQSTAPVQIVMPRLPVVTGLVTDETGKPMPRVRVYAVRQDAPAGRGSRSTITSLFGEPSGQSAATDARGRYEIEVNVPGAYLMQTSQLTLQVANPDAAETGPKVRTIVYAPAVRGGVDGRPLMLRPGDRTVVDLRLAPSTGVRVSGVMKPAARGISLSLVPRLSPPIEVNDPRALRPAPGSASDAFLFLSVPAGEYTLDAITVQNVTWDGAVHQNVALGVPANLEPTMWASVPLMVGGAAVEDLVLSLRPGLRVTGRFHFLDVSPSSDAIKGAFIEFLRADGGRLVGWQVQIRVDGDGRFVAAGLTPGSWQVRAVITGNHILKSAILSGRDVTDTPFTVGTDDLTDLVLTFGARRQ